MWQLLLSSILNKRPFQADLCSLKVSQFIAFILGYFKMLTANFVSIGLVNLSRVHTPDEHYPGFTVLTGTKCKNKKIYISSSNLHCVVYMRFCLI